MTGLTENQLAELYTQFNAVDDLFGPDDCGMGAAPLGLVECSIWWGLFIHAVKNIETTYVDREQLINSLFMTLIDMVNIPEDKKNVAQYMSLFTSWQYHTQGRLNGFQKSYEFPSLYKFSYHKPMDPHNENTVHDVEEKVTKIIKKFSTKIKKYKEQHADTYPSFVVWADYYFSRAVHLLQQLPDSPNVKYALFTMLWFDFVSALYSQNELEKDQVVFHLHTSFILMRALCEFHEISNFSVSPIVTH